MPSDPRVSRADCEDAVLATLASAAQAVEFNCSESGSKPLGGERRRTLLKRSRAFRRQRDRHRTDADYRRPARVALATISR